MKIRAHVLLLCVAIGAVLGACNRNTETVKEEPKPVKPTTFAPSQIFPETNDLSQLKPVEQKVSKVDSISVRFPASDALVVRVSGTVPSGGWTHPRLVPVDDPNTANTSKSFEFVATLPLSDDNTPSKPIYAQIRVDGVPAELKTIRIVSATNDTSVYLVRATSAPTSGAAVASSAPFSAR